MSQKRKSSSTTDLPPIPEKIYFTIGEVAKLCQLKPHVLRYWEQEFPQLNPSKRRGNRRYYQRRDVILIRRIRNLLYMQGYTIEGARQQLMSEVAKQKTETKPSTKLIREAVQELEKLAAELQEA
ncbi:MAG: MerR family transcriptional regulator [Gammaproteobacteria bacterium]|nr:MerR family transcriptional regulator [Gammaproteobacteria bacterium]